MNTGNMGQGNDGVTGYGQGYYNQINTGNMGQAKMAVMKDQAITENMGQMKMAIGDPRKEEEEKSAMMKDQAITGNMVQAKMAVMKDQENMAVMKGPRAERAMMKDRAITGMKIGQGDFKQMNEAGMKMAGVMPVNNVMKYMEN
jgi:hypothetical protein